MVEITDANANVGLDDIDLDSATVLTAGVKIASGVTGFVDVGTIKRRKGSLGSAGTVSAVKDERVSGAIRETFDKTPTGGPWRHTIIPLLAPHGCVASSGSWSYQNVSTAMNCGYTGNNAMQGEYLAYDLWLDEGSWEIVAVGKSGTSRARLSWVLNGTVVAEQDFYAATAAENVILHNAIAIAKSGLYRIKFEAATKNTSSSAYGLLLSQFDLVRTV